jgi:Molybdopterin-guanine dinucleotide biosynthesis protein A
MIAVILSGGESRRMGRDKALLDIGSERLIDRVYSRLKIQANGVLVSGPNDYGLDLTIIPDIHDAPNGPVGALYSIWMMLKSLDQTEGFFTVPVDGPNFPLNLCERLYGERSAIASNETGMHQTFAWWRMDGLSKAFSNLNFDESLSLKLMAKTCEARHVYWSDEKLFQNINTPEDFEKYLKK